MPPIRIAKERAEDQVALLMIWADGQAELPASVRIQDFR